jgi:hypothetical protein
LSYEQWAHVDGPNFEGKAHTRELVLAAQPTIWLRTEITQSGVFPRAERTAIRKAEIRENYKSIKALRELRQVGERQLPCVVVKERMEMSGGHQVSTTWLSPEVPGHVVEKISETWFEGRQQRSHEKLADLRTIGASGTDWDTVRSTVERLRERLQFLEQEMPTYKPIHHEDPPPLASLTITNDPVGLFNAYRKIVAQAETNSFGQFNGMVRFFFNWTPSNKRELGKPVAADGWGMWVMLNVWQDVGLPFAADYEVAQRYIPWDGKCAWRGYKVGDTKWRMSVQVEGNQVETIKRVHAIVDEELAGMFEVLKHHE